MILDRLKKDKFHLSGRSQKQDFGEVVDQGAEQDVAFKYFLHFFVGFTNENV